MESLDTHQVIPFPGRRRAADEPPTFKDLADWWLRTVGARRVCPDNERRHVDHLRALWDLTEEELRPWRAEEALANLLAVNGGPLAPATVNKVRATAKRIIQKAQINDRWLGRNPFELVDRYKEQKYTGQRLTLAEVRALLPKLRADREREVLMMLYLGMRPGEWKALQKVDVDFRNDEVHIHRSNGRNETKTGKERRVPIPSGLRPTLVEAVRLSSCDLVFPKADGSGERQRDDVKLSRMLRGALVEAGVVIRWDYICRRKGCGHRETRVEQLELRCPKCSFKLWASGNAPPVRYYDLRHSAATLHREAGCDPLVIQKVLGHAEESVTDSVYTHLTPEYVRRELNKLQIVAIQLSLL